MILLNVPRQDPYALAAEIFGVELPPGAAVDPERRKRLDKSVLDAVRESSQLLSAKLGREDRARLDAHLQSVNELEGWHEFSHQAAAGDAGSADKITRTVTWLESQLALLCDKLKAVQEPGGGTLLDNMTICQMNEFGYDHRHRNLPYLFIGFGQGYFKTGRLLRFQEFSNGPDNEKSPFPGTWNNNVLVSLANMMGLDMSAFGDPNYPSGPVSGLQG